MTPAHLSQATAASDGAPASPAAQQARVLVARAFVWFFASAVLARIWRAVGLWQEADANDGFVWLPVGLAADALFAALLALAVHLVARRWPRAGLAVAGTLGLAHIGWLGLNLVSFTLTQAPITFQRARGDEGVALDAHALLRWEDVIPAIAFGVVALLALPIARELGARLGRALEGGAGRATQALAACALVASGVYAADAFVFRDKNFGVADHPAFTLASSFVLGAFDERRKPTLRGAHGEKSPKDATVAELEATLDELLVARTPAVETAPPPRARAAMKNVIVVFAEGVSREHTSLVLSPAEREGAGRGGPTPNLARRARESGLELTRWHAPYHKSIAAIYSAVCSDFPPTNGTNIVEINPRIDCGEMSDALALHGVRTGLFHGGDFGFYDKLMLLGMRHWDVAKDARLMSDPLVYEENEWGIDDRAGVHHMLAWIDTLPPDERFGAFFIPITAHWPYWIPSDVEARLPPISSKNKFLNAVTFLDGAFEQLMQGLEERGLADDTAVIFMADHGETVGERPRASAGRRLAYEPSLHVPFVIVAPGMWPTEHAQSDRLASHVDLMPTILDVLGLPPDPRHRGTSVLAPDREPPRVFIGASNGPKWVGWLDGTTKFFVNRTTGMRELYDLAEDPDERNNLIGGLTDPARLAEIERLEQEALVFAAAQNARLKKMPAVDQELDMEALFFEVADMRVRRGDDVIPCARVPGERSDGQRACGDEGVLVLGRRTARGGGGKHDCILVKSPANGVLELEVRDQPWLPLITRARVAQTKRVREVGQDDPPFEAWVDGALEGSRSLRVEGHVRMPFKSPRESLLLRVGGEGPGRRDVCVTLTERAWRNRPLQGRVSPEAP